MIVKVDLRYNQEQMSIQGSPTVVLNSLAMIGEDWRVVNGFIMFDFQEEEDEHIAEFFEIIKHRRYIEEPHTQGFEELKASVAGFGQAEAITILQQMADKVGESAGILDEAMSVLRPEEKQELIAILEAKARGSSCRHQCKCC